jgi:hypothetical protein
MLTLMNKHRLWIFAIALLAAVCFLPQPAHAADVTVDLCAKAGTVVLPGNISVPIWGYAAGNCSTAGAPTLPGPQITANQGDVIHVNLYNGLPQNEPTAILFQGQVMRPDLTGAAQGGSKNYTFTATEPGTFLYEAGLLPNAEHQVAMGLYGALVVHSTVANQAYAAAGTAYNVEAVLVLSELDPALNGAANAAQFDMRNYKPTYQLLNGNSFPTTPGIAANAGDKVLLRYVNAGLQHHSMAVLGTSQSVIAQDGIPFQYAHRMVAETIAPGETSDAIATIPAATTQDSKLAVYDGNLLLNNDGGPSYGGMLTFITVAGSPAGGNAGPTTTAVAATPAGNVTASIANADSNITAAELFIDAPGASGTGLAMNAADGNFDSVLENVTLTLPPATLAGLTSGNHAIYVHGQDGDAGGTWGSLASGIIAIDNGGPSTTGVVVNPSPVRGGVAVAVTATGDDRNSGNGKVVAAELYIGDPNNQGNTPIPMATNTGGTAPVASLSASIAPSIIDSLAEGAYNIYVHSQDDAGHWGPFAIDAPIKLIVDRSGPQTSGMLVSPSASNGATGLSTSQPYVQVVASFTDGPLANVAGFENQSTAANQLFMPLIASGVADPNATSAASTDGELEAAAAPPPGVQYVRAAEGFIDTAGADGTGFPFGPRDASFNSGFETGAAYIPLTTIALLTEGAHTIYIHGQDGAGNWGPTVSVPFNVDRQAPSVSNAVLNPTIAGNLPVVVTANANDVATGNSNIGGGEIFIDAQGVNGAGIYMAPSAAAPATTIAGTIPGATIAALTEGNHTVFVHARDVAGNWSTFIQATLRVDHTPPTFSGITVAPSSIPVGTASVNLTVNNASDGANGSGVFGGEYWFDSSPNSVAPGTATQFSGLSTAINTAALTAGNHQVRVRIRDNAGNWSTGGNGVRSANLQVTAAVQDAIFADGFESGNTNAWSSRSTNSTTRLNVTAGAAMAGSFGLQAQGNNNNYVQYDGPTPSAVTYDARFYFRPNASTVNQAIFVGAGNNYLTQLLFRVNYRRQAGQPQVQVQVGLLGNTSNWINVNANATNTIEVVYQAANSGGPNPGTLRMYVNGVATQSNLTITSNNGVASVRLGSSPLTISGDTSLLYFDGFTAKRSTTPLFGP